MSALTAENIAKTFRLGHNRIGVLQDIRADLPEGKLTTIQGASGAGKTTLLHVLAGLEKPDEGRVMINGLSIYDLPADRLARLRNLHLGFVFQSFHLLPELSALENVLLPAKIARKSSEKEGKELLDRVGLSHRIEHRPSELSGGEQQRVALARALINSPQILFADEPTGNLDSHTGQDILELMLELLASRGMTAVLVTHDSSIAARGQHRLKILDGSLQEV